MKATTDMKTSKPERVELVNQNRDNGAIGQTANVLKEDVKAWKDKGWAEAGKAT